MDLAQFAHDRWVPVTVKEALRSSTDDGEDRYTDKSFLIKASFEKNSYTVLVTDMQHVWLEKLNEIAILTRMKALSPAYSRNDVTVFLPYIKRLVVNQDPTCKYFLETSSEDGSKESLSKREKELQDARDLLTFHKLPIPRSRGAPVPPAHFMSDSLQQLMEGMENAAVELPRRCFEDRSIGGLMDDIMDKLLPSSRRVNVATEQDELAQLQSEEASMFDGRGGMSQDHGTSLFGPTQSETFTQTQTQMPRGEKRAAAQEEMERGLQEILEMGEKKKATTKPKKKKII
ncbi:hypothetical protein HDU76_011997 [Blyttiomyces sp. JEL0837]|nr:hypothetical protein HDU76_011997 [Blyttiomyces sp. JEL0837]